MTLKSHFLSVKDAKMHYYDEGQGDPILFLHGMPTSAYLWRQIIPALSSSARCIAPDLIGMGKSDKPDIAYRIFDHIAYLDAFIESLDLQNITLVLHGWGSIVGFDFARRHPDRIKGLVFYESHIKPVTDWTQLSLPVQQLSALLEDREKAKHAVLEKNYMIKHLLPNAVLRKLTDEELAAYAEPFPTPASRLPLWQYLNDLPIGNGPDDVVALVTQYSKWLQTTNIPKLMFYAIPGFITTIEMVSWAKSHFDQLTLVSLDDALHFAQETDPEVFASALLSWYETL